jgi:hypothetical protein
MADVQRTRLARRFIIKSLLFFLACAAFGGWFLYDAMVAYPRRGEQYAEYSKLEYLKACRDQVQMGRASVDDPAAEYERLRANASAIRSAASGSGPGAGTAIVEQARLEWLEALSIIGRLDPAHTRISDPYAELNRLDAIWANRPAPAKLKSYDVPSQWIFAVVCSGIALWVLGLFVAVASKRYAWDSATRTLTLPGGKRLTPSDLAEVDKRKWHKFIVDLKIRDGHEHLGGQTVRLDLYRYEPLEEWVLELERAAFPDQTDPVKGEAPKTDEASEPPARDEAAAS